MSCIVRPRVGIVMIGAHCSACTHGYVTVTNAIQYKLQELQQFSVIISFGYLYLCLLVTEAIMNLERGVSGSNSRSSSSNGSLIDIESLTVVRRHSGTLPSPADENNYFVDCNNDDHSLISSNHNNSIDNTNSNIYINNNSSYVNNSKNNSNYGNSNNNYYNEDLQLIDNYNSLRNSSLLLLQGSLEDILLIHTLEYLESSEIAKFGLTCKLLYQITLDTIIWENIYCRDFIPITTNTYINKNLPLQQLQQQLQLQLQLPQQLEHNEYQNNETKNSYIIRYQQLNERVLNKKLEKERYEKDTVRLQYIYYYESILDIICIRVVIPVSLISLFLSLILYCLKVDQIININIWYCSFPIIIFLIYLLLVLILILLIYSNHYSSNSIFRDVWIDSRGPITYLFQSTFSDMKSTIIYCIALTIIAIIQLLFVAYKLSVVISDKQDRKLSWGIVFIPLWCYFAETFITARTRVRFDAHIFYMLICIFAVPLFIFFVCLTIKLDAQEDNTNKNFPLSLIFMPFWFIEGFAMLLAVCVLIQGIYR